MAVEIKVPTLGESVTEATVAKWFKAAGDAVAVDEALVELETDKVTVEVNSPVAGALKTISAAEGAEVLVDALLGVIDEGAAAIEEAPAPEAKDETKEEAAPAPTPAPEPTPALAPATAAAAPAAKPLSPAVRKLVDDSNLDASVIPATGKGGRLTKGDVQDFIAKGGAAAAPAGPLPPRPEDPREERVKMTKLRKIITARLKEAQNTAAMLTTWNEVDMGAVMDLRATYKDAFEKKHDTRLGFMSFFVRAACIGLKEWPAVNGEIYGDEIIYKNYYNIGVAVGSSKGLVVPVLRDADKMSFADIEGTIRGFGLRARDGKLGIDEMQKLVEEEWNQIKDGPLKLPQAEIDRVAAHFAPPPFETVEFDARAFDIHKFESPAFARWARTNVAAHKQPGYAIVNLTLKPTGGVPGDATAEQMDAVADLADRYSLGEIRVTHEQNLVFAHVKEADLYRLWRALDEIGFATPNLSLIGDMICCPGLDYCGLANARSIPVAQRIGKRFADLDRQLDIGELRLKISGCINACGHHHVGHIGILGVERKGEEYYQITLGGNPAMDATIGDVVGPAFSSDDVVDAVETVVTTYVKLRADGERFLDTYRRVGAEPFKERLYPEKPDAAA